MTKVDIDPQGPFSLALAAGFGFGPRAGDPHGGSEVRMAFPTDDRAEHAAVTVRQPSADLVTVEVHAGSDSDAIAAQVARILCIDRPGTEWLEVGERDQVITELQRKYPGLRPVLFHSPYEAAAWSVISHRRNPAQGRAVRERLSDAHGATFEVGGETLRSFPLPAQLCELEPGPGLDQTRCERLRAVAQAAQEGRLDAGRLRALDPEAAMDELQELPGIGPFYAGLIVARASGATDALLSAEPIVRAHAARFYGREEPLTAAELTDLAERWRPFRTWATVLIRYAGDREGFPSPKRGR